MKSVASSPAPRRPVSALLPLLASAALFLPSAAHAAKKKPVRVVGIKTGATAGTIRLTGNRVLTTPSTNTSASGGALVLNAGSVGLSGASTAILSVGLTTGTYTGLANILPSGGTLTVNPGTVGTTTSGATLSLGSGVGYTGGTLILGGSGFQLGGTLPGSNTYAGTATIVGNFGSGVSGSALWLGGSISPTVGAPILGSSGTITLVNSNLASPVGGLFTNPIVTSGTSVLTVSSSANATNSITAAANLGLGGNRVLTLVPGDLAANSATLSGANSQMMLTLQNVSPTIVAAPTSGTGTPAVIPAQVPEPSSALLALVGAGLVAGASSPPLSGRE